MHIFACSTEVKHSSCLVQQCTSLNSAGTKNRAAHTTLRSIPAATNNEQDISSSSANRAVHQNNAYPAKKSFTLSNNENKAAKTLGLIVTCLCLCWLLFFIFCNAHVPQPTFLTSNYLFKITWQLGYCNSCITPYLYTYKDFRKALKKLSFH